MTGGFQTAVSQVPAVGVAGDFCSANPIFTYDAGPGGLQAGPNGVTVGGRGRWRARARPLAARRASPAQRERPAAVARRDRLQVAPPMFDSNARLSKAFDSAAPPVGSFLLPAAGTMSCTLRTRKCMRNALLSRKQFVRLSRRSANVPSRALCGAHPRASSRRSWTCCTQAFRTCRRCASCWRERARVAAAGLPLPWLCRVPPASPPAHGSPRLAVGADGEGGQDVRREGQGDHLPARLPHAVRRRQVHGLWPDLRLAGGCEEAGA